MTMGWAGPVWGEPSPATDAPVPVRARAGAPAANYRADGGQSADFVVLAASVAGRAHRLGGGRCEDSYAWVKPGLGRLGLLIADGVSTAGRGGEGADLAVDAAARYLSSCRGWGETECRGAARRASAELLSAGGASARGKAAELSTTFVVALVTARGEGADVVLGRVGDSTAFTLVAGLWRELFTAPDNDDLHHLATDVLPFSCAQDASKTIEAHDTIETVSAHLPGGTAIVLMTDGLADPLRDGPSTVAPGLAEVLGEAHGGTLSPLALAAAADFSRRGCQDDRTIVIAWPRPPA